MMQLDTTLLNNPLYVDRAKRIRYSAGPDEQGNQVEFTLRSYLAFILDVPIAGQTMSVMRLNNINRCIDTLTDPDNHDRIEDSNFEFLKSFVEQRGIEIPTVYAAVNTLIATARRV